MSRRGNVGNAGGWPVVNYATDLRGLDGHNATVPLSIPRMKYTYLVEFNINPVAMDTMITNFTDYLHGGTLYTHLKSIDLPKTEFEIETFRSYNKYIKVPMKVEYSPAQMSFHDDATSIISSMWLDYLNYFQYAGGIGPEIITKTAAGSSMGANQYQFEDKLVPTRFTAETRAAMNIRPSLGLKMKPNSGRSFFDSITIYDLGTEPTSLNIYYFHKPFFTSVSPTALDTEDRTGLQQIDVGFEYESYYFATGQNRDDYAGVFETHLGYSSPPPTTPKQGSPKYIDPASKTAADILLGIPVDLVGFGLNAGTSATTPDFNTVVDAVRLLPNTTEDGIQTVVDAIKSVGEIQDRINDVGGIIKDVNGSINAGIATQSQYALQQEATLLQESLTTQLDAVTRVALNKSRKAVSNAATQSAADLTKKFFDV